MAARWGWGGALPARPRSASILCSLAAISALCVCVRAPPRPNKMDDSSLAAAALAVAMENARTSAVRELMLDRERAAMVAEDRGSFLAQRHYIGSLQLHQPYGTYPVMTWRDAYFMQRDDMSRAREVMHASLMAMRGGDAQRARDVLARVVRPDDEEVEEEQEEEDEVMEEEAEDGGMQNE